MIKQMFLSIAALSIFGSTVTAQTIPSSENPRPATLTSSSKNVGTLEPKQIEGTITSVDQAKKTITLEGGMTLAIPDSVPISPVALKKGARVTGTYKDHDGKRVFTSIQVEPPTKS